MDTNLPFDLDDEKSRRKLGIEIVKELRRQGRTKGTMTYTEYKELRDKTLPEYVKRMLENLPPTPTLGLCGMPSSMISAPSTPMTYENKRENEREEMEIATYPEGTAAPKKDDTREYLLYILYFSVFTCYMFSIVKKPPTDSEEWKNLSLDEIMLLAGGERAREIDDEKLVPILEEAWENVVKDINGANKRVAFKRSDDKMSFDEMCECVNELRQNYGIDILISMMLDGVPLEDLKA